MERAGADWNQEFRGGEAFALAYETQPPWDTGRPQPAIAGLVGSGLIEGRVLDAGCGTGEHALLAAGLGLAATGVDIVPAAVSQARAKATQRGLGVRFEVGDVLDLAWLGESYDTVIDSGMFHTLHPSDVARYVAELASVTAPDAHCIVLSFSDHVPGTAGPRRVSQQDLRDAFCDGWVVEDITASQIEVAFGPVDSVHAWLATFSRS